MFQNQEGLVYKPTRIMTLFWQPFGRTMLERAPDENFSELLNKVVEGDLSAKNELVLLLYDDVYRQAKKELGPAGADQTITPTALVNESFMRLFTGSRTHFKNKNRGYVFCAFAEAMRRFLVDYARQKKAQKRGKGWQRVSIDFDENVQMDDPNTVLALNKLLCEYEKHDPRGGELITYKYYCGMTLDQMANVTGQSKPTVTKYLKIALNWIRSEWRAEQQNQP